jgi:hypothetical protein
MKREPGGQPKHLGNDRDGVLLSNCTWFDCIEFCNRLSEREGRIPAYQVAGRAVTVIPRATGYRLPTEAEWEFACRAGTTTLWYFGWTAQQARTMCLRNIQEGQAHLRARTALPNPFGLLGMYAGASEWCWDWYAPGYYQECAVRGVAVDPWGPDSGAERITRGGTNYADDRGDLRLINSAARLPQDPARVQGLNGFGRVVLPLPAEVLDEAWRKKVRALTPEEQDKEVAARLKELNPGFDGQVIRRIEDVGVRFEVVTDHVTDFTPLRALTDVSVLSCAGSAQGKGHLVDLGTLRSMRPIGLNCLFTNVADLAPLSGMKLIYIDFSGTTVTDLEPLRGMPMEYLYCRLNPGIKSLAPLEGMPLKHFDLYGARVADLAPLRGMKLERLWLGSNLVTDLAPLRGMPLKVLDFDTTQVADLEPLRGMPLEVLDCHDTPVEDLAPLQGMKLTELHCEKTKVTDLSVLRGMPLKILSCDFRAERDAAILRPIKTLETINGKSAAAFWEEVDARPEAQKP